MREPNNAEPTARGSSLNLDQAYRNNNDSLFNYSVYLVGDSEAARDIVQEVFSRLAEKVSQRVSIKSVPDWLFMVTRNLCFDRIRERGRFVEYEGNINRPDTSLGQEQVLFVEQVLGRLNADERDLILLREVQRFSIIQMAAMLEITTEAVRVRLYRVRKKMQELGRK